jgi:hypothetical protein
MEVRGVSLKTGATMLFGSLGFVYTGPAEAIVGCSLARLGHPTALMAAARRAMFVRGFSGDAWGNDAPRHADAPAGGHASG